LTISFVEKLLLVIRITTLSLHYYDFSVIFGAIYKILCFRSRVEDSIYKEVLGRFLGFTVLPSVNKKGPWFFQSSPQLFCNRCNVVLRGDGWRSRTDSGEPAAWEGRGTGGIG
jgi:hypothetical protein